MLVEAVMPDVCPVKTYVYVPGTDGARNEPVEKLPPPSACAVATVTPLSVTLTVSSWPKLRPPKSMRDPAVIKPLFASIVAVPFVVVVPVLPPEPPAISAATSASSVVTRDCRLVICVCSALSSSTVVVVVPVPPVVVVVPVPPVVVAVASVIKVMSLEVASVPDALPVITSK